MRIVRLKTAGATCLIAILLTSSVTAGGLADALIEEEQVMVPPAANAPATQGALPNWVLPAVGLLVIGVIASADSGSSGDGDSTGGDTGEPPVIIDVK